jgi:transcriptional regulator with GAF, ATPase, and Fis domain
MKESIGTKIVKFEDERTTLTLPKCKLVVIDGPDKGKEFIMDKGVVQVGSKQDNDFNLNDETVSRYHLEIHKQKDTYLVKDLDSTNGTFIDGIKIKEAFVASGSIIKVGKTEIKFIPEDEKIEILPSKKTKFGDLIGSSLSMRKIFGVMEKIAPTDVTVVIEGDTGSGKELVARAIHQYSKRANKPFVVFDCSAVAENLIESELFGHEKGAFTGAHAQRQGAFELANGGTIFLDEIGELSLDLQPKLLRVLEQRCIKRVGGDKLIKIDVRIITATNRTLEVEVKKGRFREDLFFRISVVHVCLPSLKERKEDIPLLIDHFIELNNKSQNAKKIKSIDHTAREIFMNFSWPGNVRELKNAVDRAITFAQGDTILAQDLPDNIRFKVSVSDQEDIVNATPFRKAKDKWIENFEREYLINLLKRNGLNISQAAKEARIDRKSIQRLLRKYNIKARDL